MHFEEISVDGLHREFALQIPADLLAKEFGDYFDHIQSEVRLPGFRPGKVPVAHLRRLFGEEAIKKVVEKLISEGVKRILAERDERPITSPEYHFDKIDTEILSGNVPLDGKISYEAFPKVDLSPISEIALDRFLVQIPEEQLSEGLQSFFIKYRPYIPCPEEEFCEKRDKVVLDYTFRVEGFEEEHEEKGEEIFLEGMDLIPEFEEALLGMKAGDGKVVSLTLPEDYHEEHLAGCEAVYEITMKEVFKPDPSVSLDDAFAQTVGMKDLEALKESLRSKLESPYASRTRDMLKRDIFEAINDLYPKDSFLLPQALVDRVKENLLNSFVDIAKEKSGLSDLSDEEFAETIEERFKEAVLKGELDFSSRKDLDNEDVEDAEEIEDTDEMPIASSAEPPFSKDEAESGGVSFSQEEQLPSEGGAEEEMTNGTTLLVTRDEENEDEDKERLLVSLPEDTKRIVMKILDDIEYTAERRVRVTTVLSEIAHQHKVYLTNEDIEQAFKKRFGDKPNELSNIAMRVFKNRSDIFNKFQDDIFENKLLDFLIGSIKITDRRVSLEEFNRRGDFLQQKELPHHLREGMVDAADTEQKILPGETSSEDASPDVSRDKQDPEAIAL